MSAEATIQATVGPGNETGFYHITFCNLPFGASWHDLRAWIRTACEVDRIELFPKSTSAWVRVKGRDNFEKAWGLLNGGVFRGRSIIASDKNRSETIKIRESVPGSPPVGSLQTPRYYPTPPTQYGSPATSDSSQQYMATTSSQYCLGSNYAQPAYAGQTMIVPMPVPVPAHNYTQQPITTITTTAPATPVTYAAPDLGTYYNYASVPSGPSSMNPAANVFSSRNQGGGTQHTLPYRGRTEPRTQFDAYEASRRVQTQVPARQRTVHISPFPQQARVEEVTTWLRRKVGSWRYRHLQAPQNSNSRYLLGYAYVCFETAPEASDALEVLGRARFQGRRVTARMATEDEELVGFEHNGRGQDMTKVAPPTEPARMRDDARYQHERSHRSKHKELKGKASADSDKRRSSDKKAVSSSKKSSSQHDKKSSSSSSSSSSKKRSSGDKKSSGDGPVIVNGSSHKRSK